MSNFEESPNLYPSLHKYNTILEASAKLKSATHASKCLDLTDHDMVGKNETTYTKLLKVCKSLNHLHVKIWLNTKGLSTFILLVISLYFFITKYQGIVLWKIYLVIAEYWILLESTLLLILAFSRILNSESNLATLNANFSICCLQISIIKNWCYISESILNLFFQLAVLQKNLPYVHNIWKEFIWAFTRLGDVGSACEALQHLVDLVFRGGFTIKENVEGKLVISRLDVPIPFYSNLEWDRCQTVSNVTSVPSIYENNNKDHIKIGGFDLKEVKHVGRNSNIGVVMRILRLSFADVIQACAREKNHELAEQLFVQVLISFCMFFSYKKLQIIRF